MYNEEVYNAEEYGYQVWGQGLIETLTITDSDITRDVAQVLTDATSLVDTDTKDIVQQTLFDLINLVERIEVHEPAPYNWYTYNQFEYNGTLRLSEIVKGIGTFDPEYLMLVDAVAQIMTSKVLTGDSVTLVAQCLNNYGLRPIDPIFLEEFFNKRISNKALGDTVRPVDWLTVKRTNPANWAD